MVGQYRGAGGDDLDYRFTTAGVNTGDTIDTTPWVGTFGADMTYNPFTNMLWQVNVGGDNCIYELDPAGMAATGNKICPAFGTSERGLAFDPLSNTYYAGSWNDGIINHFAPDGTMLASVDVGLSIAGLAYNPSTGHLFVMVNAVGQPDVYVLDTHTADYDILGVFYLKQGTTKVLAGGQAGLEIDCAGNLWAVEQNAQVVYVANSGETGVCDWQASWLSASPISGSVVNANSAVITATVDATGVAVGTYPAYLRVVGDTPYGDMIVQVSMTVTDTAPTITSDGGGATASRSVAENTTYVTTVTATDLEGDTLAYSISGGADAAFFSLTGSPGVLAFIVPPDFEKPKDSGADNTYEVVVEVSDGTLSTTQTINVTVLDMVESLLTVPACDRPLTSWPDLGIYTKTWKPRAHALGFHVFSPFLSLQTLKIKIDGGTSASMCVFAALHEPRRLGSSIVCTSKIAIWIKAYFSSAHIFKKTGNSDKQCGS